MLYSAGFEAFFGDSLPQRVCLDYAETPIAVIAVP